jgi:tetratricopeptide (TPR) repeat protein
MRLAGDARGALEALQRAEDQAEQDGDERGKAMLLGRRGQLLRREGRFKEAWECHVKEAQLSREVRNMDGLAAALFGQVNILTGIGEQSRALQTLDEIEELARRSGDRNTLAKCMGTRAGILRRQGRFAEALALHQEEEALFRECHNELGLVIALVNKANCLLDVPGRAAHATPVAYEALTLARRAENAALIERIEAILASIERGNPTEESNNGP